MKLFTKAIEAKAQAQYHLGNDLEKQVVVAKFFNPTGSGWVISDILSWLIKIIVDTAKRNRKIFNNDFYKGNLKPKIKKQFVILNNGF